MIEQIDRKLLNLLQANFPLAERPFQVLAEQLGLTETEVLERATRMKTEGIIRHISAFCDARKLNYKTTLVALHVLQSYLDKAADAISKHPGVSHNYSRNHYYNLWFTLAMPHSSNLVKEVHSLMRQARSDDFLILPALKVFKLNTAFDLTGESLPDSRPLLSLQPGNYQLSVMDKAIVNQIQEELPLVERPFDGWAASLGLEVPALLTHLKQLKEDGVVRRFGAGLTHQAVGLTSNAMICWQVPAEQTEDMGRRLAAFHWVSHCYERLASTEWAFNLYTMIHQDTSEACRQAVAKMSLETGINHYLILFTLKEYKKTKGKYIV